MRTGDSSNSILVNWEVETSDGSEDATLTGFKLHYSLSSAANSTNLNITSSASRKDLAFVLDKSQRQFKIENLALDSRYTVCVSLIRSEGAYDKYCRDSDLASSPIDKKQPKTKLVPNPTLFKYIFNLY